MFCGGCGSMSSNKIILWLGFTTTLRAVLKGHSIRKGENHYSKER